MAKKMKPDYEIVAFEDRTEIHLYGKRLTRETYIGCRVKSCPSSALARCAACYHFFLLKVSPQYWAFSFSA